jgi:NADH-quinone oxidoreductase subunit G
VGAHQAVLATWRLMLDSGRLQDGEPHLAGTAKRAVARLSAGTAGALGLRDDDLVDVSSAAGTITLPYAVTPMPDHVVWVPTNSVGSAVRATLGVDAGAVVDLSVAERTTEVTA